MHDRPPEFAVFCEHTGSAAPLPIAIRGVTPQDAPAVAELDAQRHHLDVSDVLPLIRHEVERIAGGDPRRSCAVALLDGRVIGYGRTQWMDLARNPFARNAPSAWYLTGLVVSPAHRRRGVALALTRHRLGHLVRRGATEAWCFANERNRGVIALHARLGFEEVTREFTIPKVSFHGGRGVLFRKSLCPPRPRA